MREEHQVEALLGIRAASQRLGLGDTKTKELVRRGELLSVTIGDRRLVPSSAVDDYIKRLVAEAESKRQVPA
jgi:excisionase family DNA binding protein